MARKKPADQVRPPQRYELPPIPIGLGELAATEALVPVDMSNALRPKVDPVPVVDVEALPIEVPELPDPVEDLAVCSHPREAPAPGDGTTQGAVLFTPAGVPRRDRRRQRAAAEEVGRTAKRAAAEALRAGREAQREEHRQAAYLPKGGEAGPRALRSYRPVRVKPHRATSEVLSGAYPFLAEAGLGSDGVLIGHDSWSGAAFVYDPWELYAQGVLTNPNMLLAGIVGRGKALSTDTDVATPSGWTTMGQLAPGDMVFDELGNQTEVVATTGVMVDRPCFEVRFSDGSTLIADADHQWVTASYTERNNGGRNHGPRTTLELASSLKCGGATNHAIRLPGALALPEAVLPLDPYFLGCWLGDGNARGPRVTSGDSELFELIARQGFDVRVVAAPLTRAVRLPQPVEYGAVGDVECGWCGRKFRQTHRRQRTCSQNCGAELRRVDPSAPRVLRAECARCQAPLPRGSVGEQCQACWLGGSLTVVMRNMRILNNKHVPPAYLRSSEAQRRSLLAGLLDTDGTVAPEGRTQFTSTTSQLAADVWELCLSLGYRATLTRGTAKLDGRVIGPKWTVSFTTTDRVFRLARKLAMLSERTANYSVARNAFRYITAIVPTPSVPVRCIQVGATSGMYLAGRTMIPTHNSTIAKSLATRSIAFGKKVYVPGDPKGEWTAVSRAVGGQAIELGGSLEARLNPLDEGPRAPGMSDTEWVEETRKRRRSLLGSLTASSLGRGLDPTEHTALDVALEVATSGNDVPILPMVVDALLAPDRGAAGSTVEQLAADGRGAGHALGRMVHGDLSGLFDGPSTVRFDPSLPMVSLDLSRISGSDALIGMVMTCASAWMEAALADPTAGRRWVIYDEAWRLLRQPALLARMQSQWKLSRALGIANLMVIHRLSDLDAVGEADSEARNLALGLLADCSTKIIYAQERGEAGKTGATLGLSSTEIDQLPDLARGEGLWRIGERSFVVRHLCTPGELELFNTNQRMLDGA